MAYGLLACTANNAVLKPTCRLLHLLIIAFFLTTAVLASTDTILPSAASATFPACALSCSVLQNAAGSCLASPEDTHAVHVSCFCQSSLLSQLKTSPNGPCDSTCTNPSDRQLLQTWYNNYCNSGGATSPTTTTTTAAAGAAAAATTTSASGSNAQATQPKRKTWWDGHYKWVIMVIVLIVAFSIIAAVATWLKKRHDAKYPNLYHGVGGGSGSGSRSGSGFLAGRARDHSPGPAQPGQFSSNLGGLAPPPRGSYPNSDSIASSSRTEVVPGKVRSGAPTSRLAKTPQSADDDIEIREVTR